MAPCGRIHSFIEMKRPRYTGDGLAAFDEIFYSKNLKQLIESNTKVKEKSKIQSGRSKSPKLNLYTYFKENCDSKPSSTKKVVNLTTTYFNPNQTNFKTITKFNNIEIESQILKSIVITDLIKVY